MPHRAICKLPVMVLLVSLVCACEPTIDLSGTYMPFDYPWSGLARIEVSTPFPAPWFTGTFTVYTLMSHYIEMPIAGPVNEQNEIRFVPVHGDPPIGGLCSCRGFDDGSSIFAGSGEIPDDGLSDRLSCSTWLGEPFDPPAEVFRIDWPET